MEYRFPYNLDLSVDGVYLGRLEDLEATAIISVSEDDPYDWNLDEWRVENGDQETSISLWSEKDPLKEMIRVALEAEWRSAVHAIEIERMLRAEADADDQLPQLDHDRAIYHQSVL